MGGVHGDRRSHFIVSLCLRRTVQTLGSCFGPLLLCSHFTRCCQLHFRPPACFAPTSSTLLLSDAARGCKLNTVSSDCCIMRVLCARCSSAPACRLSHCSHATHSPSTQPFSATPQGGAPDAFCKSLVHQPLAAAAAGGAVTRTQSISISPPAASTLFPGRFPPTARFRIR